MFGAQIWNWVGQHAAVELAGYIWHLIFDFDFDFDFDLTHVIFAGPSGSRLLREIRDFTALRVFIPKLPTSTPTLSLFSSPLRSFV